MATFASRAQGIDSSEVDFINYLNIALMIISVILAAYLPFETFVLAYVVLGPLHYLTEISWLHDRGFYTQGARDWLWLFFAAAFVALIWMFPNFFPAKLGGAVLGVAVTFAAGIAFFHSVFARLLFGGLGVGVAMLATSWEPAMLLFAAFLPTLLHVYVFTGLFVLYGACKGRRLSGFLSFLVFVAAPFICLFGVGTPATYQPTDYFLDAVKPFEGLGIVTLDILGMSVAREDYVAFFRLLAFAYTYHYLNWFSKTRIINWHQISRQRFSLIGFVYVAALGMYAVSYTWGFFALMSLSLAHVLLELPLNYRTGSGLAGECVALLRRPRSR